MIRSKVTNVFFVPVALLLVTSCATGPTQPVYKAGAVGMAQTTLRGVVVGVREVKIDGNTDGLNTGGAIGGAAGSAIGAIAGSENHRLVGMGIGGVAGLVSGHFINRAINKKHGFEYQVVADNGQRYTIVQPSDVVFGVGDRVLISLPCGNIPGRLMPCD
ncbi:MAG: hypothetical protein LBQ43_02760 [Holosporales bacterium]|nr:hypothetical protein [Holosporales bacterium]